MIRDRHSSRLMGFACGLCAAIGGMVGCESAPPPAEAAAPRGVEADPGSYWFRSANASLVTIDRSTRYAIVHDAVRDLLVVEQPLELGGRLTWLVSIPSYPILGQPIDLGAGDAQGWLIEQPRGKQAHSAPLRGSVTLDHRDGETLRATLIVTADTALQTAGDTVRASLTLARKVTFPLTTTRTPQYEELDSASGRPAP